MSCFKKVFALCLPTMTAIVGSLFMFCAEDSPDSCGDGQPLNSFTQFCHNGVAVDKCGGNTYNPTTHFCANGSLHELCNGQEYDPAITTCDNGVVISLCGGIEFNPSTHFCDNNDIFQRCNGQTYTPPNNPCLMRTLVTHVSPPPPNVGGVVSITPNQTSFLEGTTVTATAIPAPDFKFLHWLGAPESVDANSQEITFEIGAGNISLMANFIKDGNGEAVRYTLTTEVTPTNGGIVSPVGTTSHYDGVSVQIIARPARGFEFVEWEGFGIADENSDTTTISMTENRTARANFKRITYTLTVNRNPTAGGTITVNGTATTIPATHNSGTTVEICAVPSTNHLFTSWSGASTSDDLCVSIVMDDNKTLAANFMQGFIDARDGQRYRTVTIGGRMWMAQNLNFQTSSGSNCYDEDPANCDIYGRLYTWVAAMDIDPLYRDSHWNGDQNNHQGICPVGWRVPSAADWDALITVAGGSAIAGRRLKSQTGWNDNGNGTDEFGFSALPGGTGSSTNFNNMGIAGHWYTTTEQWSNSDHDWRARGQRISNDQDNVVNLFWTRGNRFSVRCVRN